MKKTVPINAAERGFVPGDAMRQGGGKSRGFVLTFSAILLVSLLVLFAVFYLGRSQEQEEDILSSAGILKAGFLADDIETDFNRLLGTGVDINMGASLATITITDKIGADMNKLALNDLKDFMEGGFASAQNAAIQLDVSELVDGRAELMFSNGLRYDYSYSDDNIVQLYVPGGNTGITQVDLNVTVDSSSVSVTPWAWQDTAGDINVNLHYADRNSSNAVTHYGRLDSAANNSYAFAFSAAAGDSFTINIGNIDGNLKAVRLTGSIDESGVQAIVWMKALVPKPSGGLGAYWNADLNYSQADVNVHRKIGVWKG